MNIRFEFKQKQNIQVEDNVISYDYSILREYGIAGEHEIGRATCYSDKSEDSFCFKFPYPHSMTELNQIADLFSNLPERKDIINTNS